MLWRSDGGKWTMYLGVVKSSMFPEQPGHKLEREVDHEDDVQNDAE
jgi:hypothetical protein